MNLERDWNEIIPNGIGLERRLPSQLCVLMTPSVAWTCPIGLVTQTVVQVNWFGFERIHIFIIYNYYYYNNTFNLIVTMKYPNNKINERH